MGEVAGETAPAGGGFKHLVVVKFKEGVNVEEIMKGLEKLASDIDTVKAFQWGEDVESEEMLRQGFTHAFLMTFESKEDYIKFVGHKDHVEFSQTFSAAIDKIVLLDFNVVSVKPPTPPPPQTASPSITKSETTDGVEEAK